MNLIKISLLILIFFDSFFNLIQYFYLILLRLRLKLHNVWFLLIFLQLDEILHSLHVAGGPNYIYFGEFVDKFNQFLPNIE